MYTMIGTSHFTARFRALRYYKPYGFVAADVDAKIKAGEITIGLPPPLKAGETYSIDEDGRYFIIVESRERA